MRCCSGLLTQFCVEMWTRQGVKHPGTGEPSISSGVRDILMFSMLKNLLLLLLLLLGDLSRVPGARVFDARANPHFDSTFGLGCKTEGLRVHFHPDLAGPHQGFYWCQPDEEENSSLALTTEIVSSSGVPVS